MTKATRDEYDRTVQLAEAAIKGHKKLGLVLKKPSAEALMAAVQEKVGRGEVPPDAELDALAVAIAAQNTPPKRGRPKKMMDMAVKGAFCVAYIATAGSGLTNYRNSASGHRMTRCDAVAEAMQAAGYTSLTTYDAAAAELKSWRRSDKRMAETMRAVWQQFSGFGKLTKVMNAAFFTPRATCDAAMAGLGSIRRSSKRLVEFMTHRDAAAEARNAAFFTSLTTCDAAAAGLGSILRSDKRLVEFANAARRSEDPSRLWIDKITCGLGILLGPVDVHFNRMTVAARATNAP